MDDLALKPQLTTPGLTALWLWLVLFIALPPQAWSTQQAPDDALNPGDVLQLTMPGEESLSGDFAVDTQGNITLPEVGPLHVAGSNLEAARATIHQALGQVYKELGQLDIRLKERRLLVSVLGYVRKPSQVTLPADGNVQTALQAAEGLVPGAQLDKLQIRRGEQVLPVNYKAYLDSGDLKQLPPLQTGDVVFVPASPLIGNVQIDFDAATLASGGDAAEDRNALKVFGEVQKPGSFSFKPGSSVVDALMRAGGVTRFAAVEQIRVITDNSPTVFNLKEYLDSGDRAMMPELKAGATIFVPIVEDEIKSGRRTVYVMGEVAKPGAFEGKEGATLLDILANAGGPTRYAESRQIRILKKSGEVTPFDLGAYTEGDTRQKLPTMGPGDAIFVPEKSSQLENSWLKVPPKRAVYIMGAVARPGRYEWSDEMSLLDILAHAGGPNARADVAHVQIMPSPDSRGQPILFDLDRYMRQGSAAVSLPQVKAGYTITIPELPQDPSDNKANWVRQSKENSIYIMGAVGAPGRYVFNDTMGFLDILSAANGPSTQADLQRIRITQRSGGQAAVRELNLVSYFETGDESVLPQLQAGDMIYVPSMEGSWLQQPKEQTVRVLGAVKNPGRYRFDNNMGLMDLLAEAGGPTDSAYLKKIVVLSQGTEYQASVFDLDAFIKAPSLDTIPPVRAGDTVYIPDTKSSQWRIFMDGVRDTLSIATIVVLIAAL